MFESFKKIGQGIASLFPELKKTPSRAEMLDARAMVDPSRLLSSWGVQAYNPSYLVTRKGMAIFDQMQRDEQVKAALKFKKDAVIGSGWEVVSPGKMEADWEVTEFVKDTFKQLDGGFHRFLIHTLSALSYGYSVAERIYKVQEEGKWKGKMVLQRVQALKPHFLQFIVDPYGVLQGIVQQSTGLNAVPLPPAKVVIYSYAQEFSNYYGTSDLESCYRAWWTKENAYKWLAVTLERFGMPPLFGLYDPNAYPTDQLTELKKIIKNIQNGTMGIIPRSNPDALEIWSQTIGRESSNIFLTSIEAFDQHIARALLVPSLIGMSAEKGQQGSLARSRTHFDTFMLTIAQLQADLANNVLNTQVIPQLCDLNFPNLSVYPIFQFVPPSDEDVQALMTAWSGLVTGRVVGRIEDDEAHIRKLLGFPENDEPTLEPLPEPKGVGGAEGKEAGKPEEGKGTDKKLGLEGIEIHLDDLTNAQVEYAAREGGTWKLIAGRQIFVGSTPAKENTLEHTLAEHAPVKSDDQQRALLDQLWVAEALGAKAQDSIEPVDVVGEYEGEKYGIEVYSLSSGDNDIIKLSTLALKTKLAWARQENAKLHTIIIDGRDDFYERQVWYGKGVGSIGLDHMLPVKDAEHLRSLVQGETSFEEEFRQFKAWDASAHPREPAGTAKGGQWQSKSGARLVKGKWRPMEKGKQLPPKVLARLKELPIPPAWKNVRVDTNPKAGLQALGIDVKGKEQRLESREATAQRHDRIFSRLRALNGQMPRFQRQALQDMKSRDVSLRQTAAASYLISRTGFRVGGQETGGDKKAYGATTLLGRHVQVFGGSMHFNYPGKSGVIQEHDLTDKVLSSYFRSNKAAGSAEWFPEATHNTVRAYFKAHVGSKFSTKDMRTWTGTSHALNIIASMPVPKTMTEFKHSRLVVGRQVAMVLGNSPAKALESYIDPSVFRKWESRL